MKPVYEDVLLKILQAKFMNMKNRLFHWYDRILSLILTLLGFSASAGFTACMYGVEYGPNPNYMEIKPRNVHLGFETGEKASIEVLTNDEKWYISNINEALYDFFTLSPTEGKNKEVITITTKTWNSSRHSRDGHFDIMSANNSMTVYVVQDGTPDLKEITDSVYIPSLSDLQHNWAAEYEGWDVNQEKSVFIKKFLTLKKDLTYTNIIKGRFREQGENKYSYDIDLEHEQGTYSYDEKTSIITFMVKTDSILDFKTQVLKGYSKKKYFDKEVDFYKERVTFTKKIDGERRWIAIDNYIRTSATHLPVTYVMNIFKGDNYYRQ